MYDECCLSLCSAHPTTTLDLPLAFTFLPTRIKLKPSSSQHAVPPVRSDPCLAAACRWPGSSADKDRLRSLPLPSSCRHFASPAYPIIKSDLDLLKMTIPPPVPVLHVQTPLVYSSVLSERMGHSIFLKLETDQVSGSFKMRGIGAACQAAKERTGENVHLVVASGESARTLPCSQAVY